MRRLTFSPTSIESLLEGVKPIQGEARPARRSPDGVPVRWPSGGGPVPIFAIVGWREGDDVEILGTGVLIASKLVLTAGHVVRRPRSQYGSNTSRYRVYSRWTGINTVSDIHSIPELTRTSVVPGAGLAILELESPVPDALRPVLPSWDPLAAGTAVHSFGFGGDYTGLLQAMKFPLVACHSANGLICISPSARLGPRDSGAPLLVPSKEGDSYRAAGVYAGLRRASGSGEVHPRFERFAVAIREHKKALQDILGKFSSSSSRGMKRLEIDGLQKPDPDFDPPAYTIGIDEIYKHQFKVPNDGNKKILIVAVNSTAIPLRSRPRMTVRLYRNDALVDRREYPGPLQAFRLPLPFRSRRRQGIATSGHKSDTWHIEVRSETEVAYQVTATLYDDSVTPLLPSTPRPRVGAATDHRRKGDQAERPGVRGQPVGQQRGGGRSEA